MPLVEQRVGREASRMLGAYRDITATTITGGGCNCYPWPDSDNDALGDSDPSINRGRFPLKPSPHDWGAKLTDTVAVPPKDYYLPTLPAWFAANEWNQVLHYTVGSNALPNKGKGCTTCEKDPLLPPPTLLKGTLALDGQPGYAMILLTPGAAAPGQVRTNWNTYIDDVPNRSGDRWVKPGSKQFDRDRLFPVGDLLPPESCTPNAKLLIKNLTCHCTGGQCWNQVKSECVIAANNMAGCPACYNAGQVMITPPCRNTLNPKQCQAALATLQGC
jgi:hypothetical protein